VFEWRISGVVVVIIDAGDGVGFTGTILAELSV
jgi:hypothetical protein